MPKKSKFTDEQIIRAVREVESGEEASTVCRKLGITEQTLYRWKTKFAGMDVSDARKLRALEDENAQLKKLLVDQLLATEALKLVLSKKW